MTDEFGLVTTDSDNNELIVMGLETPMKDDKAKSKIKNEIGENSKGKSSKKRHRHRKHKNKSKNGSMQGSMQGSMHGSESRKNEYNVLNEICLSLPLSKEKEFENNVLNFMAMNEPSIEELKNRYKIFYYLNELWTNELMQKYYFENNLECLENNIENNNRNENDFNDESSCFYRYNIGIVPQCPQCRTRVKGTRTNLLPHNMNNISKWQIDCNRNNNNNNNKNDNFYCFRHSMDENGNCDSRLKYCICDDTIGHKQIILAKTDFDNEKEKEKEKEMANSEMKQDSGNNVGSNEEIIERVNVPNCQVFGSTAVRLDYKHSDLDIAIPATVLNPSLDRFLPRSRQQQQYILRLFLHALQKSNDRYRKEQKSKRKSKRNSKNNSKNNSKHSSKHSSNHSSKHGSPNVDDNGNEIGVPFEFDIIPILKAKVPILKLHEPKSRIEIDIAVLCNQSKMCNLISYYVNFDNRVSPFLICIKNWAKKRHICDASDNWPNSFGFILLAIKCLQLCQPPVLPIMSFIDDMHNDGTNVKRSVKSLSQSMIPQDIINDAKDNYGLYFVTPFDFSENAINKSTILELLIIFFEMYSRFDFDHLQISITRPDLEAKNLSQFESNHGKGIRSQSGQAGGNKYNGSRSQQLLLERQDDLEQHLLNGGKHIIRMNPNEMKMNMADFLMIGVSGNNTNDNSPSQNNGQSVSTFADMTRFSRKLIAHTTMLVEDPINKFMNVTRNVREYTLSDLKQEFERGYYILSTNGDWSQLMQRWQKEDGTHFRGNNDIYYDNDNEDGLNGSNSSNASGSASGSGSDSALVIDDSMATEAMINEMVRCKNSSNNNNSNNVNNVDNVYDLNENSRMKMDSLFYGSNNDGLDIDDNMGGNDSTFNMKRGKYTAEMFSLQRVPQHNENLEQRYEMFHEWTAYNDNAPLTPPSSDDHHSRHSFYSPYKDKLHHNSPAQSHASRGSPAQPHGQAPAQAHGQSHGQSHPRSHYQSPAFRQSPHRYEPHQSHQSHQSRQYHELHEWQQDKQEKQEKQDKVSQSEKGEMPRLRSPPSLPLTANKKQMLDSLIDTMAPNLEIDSDIDIDMDINAFMSHSEWDDSSDSDSNESDNDNGNDNDGKNVQILREYGKEYMSPFTEYSQYSHSSQPSSVAAQSAYSEQQMIKNQSLLNDKEKEKEKENESDNNNNKPFVICFKIVNSFCDNGYFINGNDFNYFLRLSPFWNDLFEIRLKKWIQERESQSQCESLSKWMNIFSRMNNNNNNNKDVNFWQIENEFDNFQLFDLMNDFFVSSHGILLSQFDNISMFFMLNILYNLCYQIVDSSFSFYFKKKEEEKEKGKPKVQFKDESLNESMNEFDASLLIAYVKMIVNNNYLEANILSKLIVHNSGRITKRLKTLPKQIEKSQNESKKWQSELNELNESKENDKNRKNAKKEIFKIKNRSSKAYQKYVKLEKALKLEQQMMNSLKTRFFKSKKHSNRENDFKDKRKNNKFSKYGINDAIFKPFSKFFNQYKKSKMRKHDWLLDLIVSFLYYIIENELKCRKIGHKFEFSKEKVLNFLYFGIKMNEMKAESDDKLTKSISLMNQFNVKMFFYLYCYLFSFWNVLFMRLDAMTKDETKKYDNGNGNGKENDNGKENENDNNNNNNNKMKVNKSPSRHLLNSKCFVVSHVRHCLSAFEFRYCSQTDLIKILKWDE